MRISPNISKSLIRNGISQLEREKDMLAPDSIKIDDRETDDLLAFLYRFARQVCFYDMDGTTSDWTHFFESSLPVQITLISKFDYEAIKSQLDKILQTASFLTTKLTIHDLLSLTSNMIFQIHDWTIRLGEDTSGLSALLHNIIKMDLQSEVKRFIRITNTAGKVNNNKHSSFSGDNANQVNEAKDVDFSSQRPFSDLQKGKNPYSLSIMDLMDLETELLELRLNKKEELLMYRRILEELAYLFLDAISSFIKQAPDFLEKSINSNNEHQPHFALLLTFLRLFRKNQQNLNDLSGKHLDFFYKNILKLKPAAAHEDKVHLIFQLADNLQQQELEKGTGFLAGEDANGETISYQLEEAVVINKAQVANLQTLFLEEVENQIKAIPQECGPLPPRKLKGIYKASLANSADGKGAAFMEEQSNSWPTLGNRFSRLKIGEEQQSGRPLFQEYDTARLGLVIASPVLLLQEGQRHILIKIELDWSAIPDTYFDLNQQFNEFKAAFDTHFIVNSEVLQLAEEEGLNGLVRDYFESESIERETSFDALWTYPTGNNIADFDRNIFKKFVHRKHGFKLSLSGESGWLNPYDVVMHLEETGRFISININLDENFDPITFPIPDALGEDYDVKFPLLKLEWNHDTMIEEDCSLYHYFRFVKIIDTQIQVQACGLKNVIVQNKEAVLDAGKPFMPFGTAPKAGDPFYIGSKEIFCKNWQTVRLNWEWDVDPDLENGEDLFHQIYNAYFKDTVSKDNFKVIPELLTAKAWKKHEEGGTISNLPIFPANHQDKESAIVYCETTTILKNQLKFSKSNFGESSAINPNTLLLPLEPWSIYSKEGFLSLSLAVENADILRLNSFLHEKYPSVLALQTQANALLALDKCLLNAIYENEDGKVQHPDPDKNKDCNYLKNENEKFTVPTPLEPYTPVIKEFSLDYSAEAKKHQIELIHLYPCEGNFLKIELSNQPDKTPTLLPTFTQEGHLYIGLRDLIPGSSISLLFQMAESTADPYLDKAAIKWHYLIDNNWEGNELQKDIHLIVDETEGLIQSGIIQFAIPSDISNKNTSILPKEYHWIRATATFRSLAVAETIAIHTQAAKVKFMPTASSDLQRLSAPLEKGSISEPAQSIAALQGLEQIYPSFQGQPEENNASFYTRVSEHLRHKGRAIALFDYERLVLQAFPEIYRVKCMGHTLGRKLRGVEDLTETPGFVSLVVVPNLKSEKFQFANQREPKVTTSMLLKIQKFLQGRVSPFVCVRVLNPIYEFVQVKARIKFHTGKSEDFYAKKLERGLEELLSPWVGATPKDISFGGNIYKSFILNFIEQQPYVDYIRDFKLFDQNGKEQPEIHATTPRSILVSGKHQIWPFSEICCITGEKEKIGGEGIGYYAIDKNLEIK